MKTIIRSKIIALDSSHLGGLARDKFSTGKGDQARAAAFERAFEATGGLLLLCLHHIEELLTHRDKDVVANRIAFISSLPLVATIRAFGSDDLIGSVLDVQLREVAIAYKRPEATAITVRDEAARDMMQLASGLEVIKPFLSDWSTIHDHFIRREEHRRHVVAISRSAFADIADRKVSDFIGAGSVNAKDLALRFREFHQSLCRDIREHGDKRINDPERSAAEFLHQLWQFSINFAAKENPGLQILLTCGVSPSEIDPQTTVGDVCRWAVFRQKLSILNQHLRLPWEEVKLRVTEDRLPSAIIQAALTQFRPDTHEWRGSDLTDGYLACLSPYADITYVDKRTHEGLRRARRKLTDLAALVRRIEKARAYDDIAAPLSLP